MFGSHCTSKRFLCKIVLDSKNSYYLSTNPSLLFGMFFACDYRQLELFWDERTKKSDSLATKRKQKERESEIRQSLSSMVMPRDRTGMQIELSGQSRRLVFVNTGQERPNPSPRCSGGARVPVFNRPCRIRSRFWFGIVGPMFRIKYPSVSGRL